VLYHSRCNLTVVGYVSVAVYYFFPWNSIFLGGEASGPDYLIDYLLLPVAMVSCFCLVMTLGALILLSYREL